MIKINDITYNMTYYYSPVTFRYRAIFTDGSIRYFIDMAELRRLINISDLSNISDFEKYHKNAGWVSTYIRFKK